MDGKDAQIKLKILIPLSSFLLALLAGYLRSMQMSMHWTIAKLYMIEDVSDPVRHQFVSYDDTVLSLSMLISLISIVLAVVSLYDKLCNRIIGGILLSISILIFLSMVLIVV